MILVGINLAGIILDGIILAGIVSAGIALASVMVGDLEEGFTTRMDILFTDIMALGMGM